MICERCGLARAKTTGRWCAVCYATGEAAPVDAGMVAAHIRALKAAGLPLVGIAETVGCSSRTLIDIVHGRRRTTRQWIANGVLAIPLPDGCAVCDDVATAALSSSDPNAIAARVGKSVDALHKHLYRHGRSDLGRMFNRHNRKKSDA